MIAYDAALVNKMFDEAALWTVGVLSGFQHGQPEPKGGPLVWLTPTAGWLTYYFFSRLISR